MVYRHDGGQLGVAPSGFAPSPDPLPACRRRHQVLPLARSLNYQPSTDRLHYRVLTSTPRSRPAGRNRVRACSPRQWPASKRRSPSCVRALAAGRRGRAGVALIVGWFIIRRDLRPLERSRQPPSRISAGDLSQRVGVPDDSSEVGRLGHAFDAMLDQIQARLRQPAPRAGGQGAQRDAAAPVRRRRLARAAHAADRACAATPSCTAPAAWPTRRRSSRR